MDIKLFQDLEIIFNNIKITDLFPWSVKLLVHFDNICIICAIYHVVVCVMASWRLLCSLLRESGAVENSGAVPLQSANWTVNTSVNTIHPVTLSLLTSTYNNTYGLPPTHMASYHFNHSPQRGCFESVHKVSTPAISVNEWVRNVCKFAVASIGKYWLWPSCRVWPKPAQFQLIRVMRLWLLPCFKLS